MKTTDDAKIFDLLAGMNGAHVTVPGAFGARSLFVSKYVVRTSYLSESTFLLPLSMNGYVKPRRKLPLMNK